MREAASFFASQCDTAPSGALAAIVRSIEAVVHGWNSRRKIAKLNELDDHLLADIGINRRDVRWALDLPFSYDPGLELQRRAAQRRRGWKC